MDMSYVTIPIFAGEFKRLYRETQFAYIISDHHNPSNHPIYVEEDEFGSSIMHLAMNDNDFQPQISEKQHFQGENEQHSERGQIWKLCFDGASSKEGSGPSVVLISPTQQKVTISYILQFSTTNNTTEYEALVLGMKATKDLRAEQLITFGDSELVIKQVRNNYQVKNSKLKNYRNEVWDLI